MVFITDYIKKIAFFMIFTSVTVNIMPENGYKKYVRLVCGIILIIIVINPFMELIKEPVNAENIFNNYSGYYQESSLEEEICESRKQNYIKLIEEDISDILKKQGICLRDVCLEIEDEQEELRIKSVKLYVNESNKYIKYENGKITYISPEATCIVREISEYCAISKENVYFEEI